MSFYLAKFYLFFICTFTKEKIIVDQEDMTVSKIHSKLNNKY